jgi:hypothetical protein
MTITFENDSDVIVYALEKIISFARKTNHLFVANCVWWIAGLIGLDSGLINYIDNLGERKRVQSILSERRISSTPKDLTREQRLDSLGEAHPDRAQQIISERGVSSTPRDLTKDQRLDLVLAKAEECLATSKDIRNSWHCSQINPLPQTKNQLKKARKTKRLQEGRKKEEVERHQRLEKIRATVIKNLSKE